MTLQFDFENIKEDETSFHVAIGRGKTPKIGWVRIGNAVRHALNTAVANTIRSMREYSDIPETYDPANIHEPSAHMFVPIESSFTEKAKYLYDVINPDELSEPLEFLPKIDLYMAEIFDISGNTLTAVKKTSDFGRMLKRGFMARIADGGLELDNEPKFQLSEDFDFLIEKQGIFVHRYKPFEGACNLDTAIRESARANIAYIQSQATFIDFSSIEESATKSVKSARVIASIRANNYGVRVNIERVRGYCKQYDIGYTECGGIMRIDPENHLNFLRLVGRQILGVELVPGEPEVFHAASRTPYR